jgi:hypothetical protein
MSDESDYLREQAKRCLRLASMAYNPEVEKGLRELAIEYVERANKINAGTLRDDRI